MDIKSVIGEIHRRSLWQVLAIYLGASWLVLQVAEHVVEQFGLPEWAYGVALLLLLVGLPIVLATAFVQEGPPGADHPDAPRDPVRPGAEAHAGSHGLLTWRNALVGAVGASALWGVVAAGWLLVAPGRGEETGPPRGAEITALDDAEGPEDGDLEPEDPDGPELAAAGEGAGAGAEPAGDVGREPAPVEGVERNGREADPPSDPPRRAARPPEPPPGDRERGEVADLLEATTRAAELARASGAVERGVDLAAADSLLGEARAAEAAGDLRRAQRELASARALYDDATRRAGASWRAAADSAARAVEALRARARPSADGYEGGEADRRQAAAASGRGDHRGAVQLLRRAAASYERALPAPADGAAADREAAGEEGAAAAGEEEVREVVRETLGRLERALEAEDLDALGRVWVTLDAASADGFRSFFERVRDFEVEIRIQWETLVASASRVAVSSVTTWSYYDERLREPAGREPFEQAFELVRRDGEWVVVRY